MSAKAEGPGDKPANWRWHDARLRKGRRVYADRAREAKMEIWTVLQGMANVVVVLGVLVAAYTLYAIRKTLTRR